MGMFGSLGRMFTTGGHAGTGVGSVAHDQSPLWHTLFTRMMQDKTGQAPTSGYMPVMEGSIEAGARPGTDQPGMLATLLGQYKQGPFVVGSKRIEDALGDQPLGTRPPPIYYT